MDNPIIRAADRAQVRASCACSNFWQGPGRRLLTVEVLAILKEPRPFLDRFRAAPRELLARAQCRQSIYTYQMDSTM